MQEVSHMLKIEELDHIWYVLEGRMSTNPESLRIAQKYIN